MASFTERIVGAARLDVRIYEEVEADTSATGQAMAVVLLASLSGGLAALSHGAFIGIISMVLGSLIGWFIWAFLTYWIGTKLMPEPQTQSNLGELLRTIGFASAPGILGILGAAPLFGWIISLVIAVWMLVAMVIAVRQALDFQSTGRAVIVCVIGWIVYVVIRALLFGLTRI
jgi:hypothetical protein